MAEVVTVSKSAGRIAAKMAVGELGSKILVSWLGPGPAWKERGYQYGRDDESRESSCDDREFVIQDRRLVGIKSARERNTKKGSDADRFLYRQERPTHQPATAGTSVRPAPGSARSTQLEQGLQFYREKFSDFNVQRFREKLAMRVLRNEIVFSAQ
ncbi:MAG TPA: hypothetical protein VEV17_20485 [Bryobacteraceae bacterium]|nr:hypothetical protein [Bryobacteraceae bacterium]